MLVAWIAGTAQPALAVADDEPDCAEARLDGDLPPTPEAWQRALGPDSMQLRIRITTDPNDWTPAYAPRWEAEGLLSQRQSWPPETSRIAWEEMTRVETLVTGSPVQGMAIGGAIGGGIAGGLCAACLMDDGGGLCGLLGLFVAAFTVPAGIIIGGSLGQDPHWEPVFCAPSVFEPTPPDSPHD
jgi:hypothetical protein